MSSYIAAGAATNILKISIDVITEAQAWRSQVHGAYSLLYPWMVGDWLHLEDFDQWEKTFYSTHIHPSPNGVTGVQATKTVVMIERALSYLESVAPLGAIRRGAGIMRSVTEFFTGDRRAQTLVDRE